MQQGCFVLPMWSSDSIAQDGHWTGVVPTPPQLPFIREICFGLLITNSGYFSFNAIILSTTLLLSSPKGNVSGSPFANGVWNWKPILLTTPFHSSTRSSTVWWLRELIVIVIQMSL